MKPYQLSWEPKARRQFRKLDAHVRKIVRTAIESLAEEPRPLGAIAMKGRWSGCLRLRIAPNFRVIYRIEEDHCFILVVAVGHRREIYRG